MHMDWKRLYYLRSDVMGYLCYDIRQVYGLYRWNICSYYTLQMITCSFKLCYLPPTLIAGWTG